MKISKAFFEHFLLKLRTPFRFGNNTLTHKEGFLLKLSDDRGRIGMGTIEPFEYFGTESFQSAGEQLSRLSSFWESGDSDNPEEILDKIKNLFGEYPATHSGIEQAILSLCSSSEDKTFPHLPGNDSRKLLRVNGVVGLGDVTEVIREVGRLLEAGRKTIKIKCGREKTFQDLKVFMAVRKEFGDKVILRGDANGKWTKTQAVEVLKAFEDINIEYMEQPVRDLNEFEFLKSRVKTPIAADESFRGLNELETILSEGTADYLILKPIPAGGLLNSIKIIDRCKVQGTPVIVTTSMDSCIGKRISVLAATRLDSDRACGLDTTQFFEADLAEDVYPVVEGKITITQPII
ncbi:MAG: o-succinylbenzoate synthase [Ignavibacteriaceae bacterium]|nr:o-succinylbenzoate synthase [Ignavibacteriaceae bacterium]